MRPSSLEESTANRRTFARKVPEKLTSDVAIDHDNAGLRPVHHLHDALIGIELLPGEKDAFACESHI
jgi:hypothetical protein